jgi:Holliday junction resolvase-like predicted endonuclease
VSWSKRRRLGQLAALYVKARGLGEVRCRFDVVAVTVDGNTPARVRHLPHAFELE